MASPYGHQHRKDRAALLAGSDSCVHCGALVDAGNFVADHQPPLSMHDHRPGSGCCVLVPSCLDCSHKQAGALGGARTAEMFLAKYEAVEWSEPADRISADDPRWRVPWLLDLLDVPPDATWPRWMSLPHPLAVGSYGMEAEEYARTLWPRGLRWWQRLALRRMLEHDADGVLVWRRTAESTARQVGKSVGLTSLGLWRLRQRERFGESQMVLTCAHRLRTAAELQRPARHWARNTDGWNGRESEGGWAVENLVDDSRWIILPMHKAEGYTFALVMLDEAWKLDPSEMAESVMPTLTAPVSSHLVMASTARRVPTDLFPSHRQEAIDAITEPDDLLILEWSAAPDADPDDRDEWRAASPHWTPNRERDMASMLKRARSGELADEIDADSMAVFRGQWLNIWGTRRHVVRSGDPLIDAAMWARQLSTERVPRFQMVAALNDNYGRGCAVAVAGVTASEGYAVSGMLYDDLGDAWDWLAANAENFTAVCVGGTLWHDPRRVGIAAVCHPRGAAETRADLPMLRRLATDGVLTHTGDIDLADQVIGCRVRTGEMGLSVATSHRSDLLKAAAWAVAEMHRQVTSGAAGGIS